MDMVAGTVKRARNVGTLVVVAFGGFTAMLILTDAEPPDAGSWIYLSVVVGLAAAIWWFAVAKPIERATGNSPAQIGLILGILGVLSSVFFWTGYNVVFGIAALTLGVEGTRRARLGQGRDGMAQAAKILGALSAAIFVILWITYAVSELV